MDRNELREKLAALMHDQWAGWMGYFFNKCQHNPDGSITVPAGYVAALMKQMDTTYEHLSDQEKDLDRAEADRVLKIVNAHYVARYLHDKASPLEQAFGKIFKEW